MSKNLLTFTADRLDKASWHDVLVSFDDANIWQSWAYGAARWDADGIEHARLCQGKTVLAATQLALPKVPILGRPVAYARWGPVWRRGGAPFDLEICQRFLQELREHYALRRKTVLWVRPRSVDDGALAAAFEAAGFVKEKGQLNLGTFLLDLAPDLEAIRAGMRKSWRRNLKRAEGQSFTFERRDGLPGFDVFMTLFHEMAARKGLPVDDELAIFQDIQPALPETQRFQIWICRLDDEPLAALAVSALGDTAVGLFSVTSNKGRDLRASYALDWHCIGHYKDQGYRWYDIEGDEVGGVNDYKAGLVGVAGHVKFVGAFMSRERPVLRALLSLAKRAKEKAG
jgi:hypothetical protein